MIHGNSNDPVNVKKIALKIWTLRDEILDTIKNKMDESGEVADIESIVTEYHINEGEGRDIGGVKDEADLDDSEDAMAAALAEAGGDEEGSEEDGEKEESEESSDEDDMAAAMLADQAETEAAEESEEDNSDGVKVVQRRPKLQKDRVFHAKTLLAEIAMDRMFFFCSKSFTEGQSVVIEFIIPQRFVINAEVVYCRLFNMKSRIISKNKLPYRVAVDFNFLKEGERTLLRQFLKTIEPEVLEHVDTNKMQKNEDDDDEFSELDDL